MNGRAVADLLRRAAEVKSQERVARLILQTHAAAVMQSVLYVCAENGHLPFQSFHCLSGARLGSCQARLDLAK